MRNNSKRPGTQKATKPPQARTPKRESITAPPPVRVDGSDSANVFGFFGNQVLQTYAVAHGLSKRECCVLKFTCRGLPRKAMATRLRITLGAVDSYCARLHKKTRVKTEVELLRSVARFAARIGKRR